MLDLSKLSLFRNADALIKDLEEYQKDENMIKGSEVLALAMKKADLTDSVFNDENLAQYALLAFQQELISEAQFVSILLIWSAKKDYPGTHMNNLKIHQLSSEDTKSQKVFEQFIKLQTVKVQGGLMSSFSLDDVFDQNKKDKIINELLSEEIPNSERCFITFEIGADEENTALFKEFHRVGFELFTPKRHKNTFEVMVPSFTMIQTTLDNLVLHPKKLKPRIGDDSFEDVLEMHKEDGHPFGLSFPGFEKEEADNIKTGCLGFPFHDIYHATLLAFTPHKDLLIELIHIGKELISKTDKPNKKYFQEATESLIDNEFRQYTKGNTLNEMLSKEDKDSLTKEMTVVLSMHSILSKTILYANKLNRANLDLENNELDTESKESILSYKKKLEQLAPKHAVAKKLNFCQQFIGKLFAYQGQLNQEHIDLAKLMEFIIPENKLLNTLGLNNNRYFIMDPSQEIDILSINLIRDQFIKFLNNPEQKKENPWLKQYFNLKEQLKNAVTNNDSEQLKSILEKKEYVKYIANLNRIHGENPSLIEQAAQLGYLDIVQILHQSGAELNTSMLFTAVQNKDLNLLKYLLDSGLNPYTLDEKNLSIIDYCLEGGLSDCLMLRTPHCSPLKYE